MFAKAIFEGGTDAFRKIFKDLYGVYKSITVRKMNYNLLFRELIYSSDNWAAQSAASKLQQAFCQWRASEKEHNLVWGKANVIGLVHICLGYPELEFVYNRFLRGHYNV